MDLAESGTKLALPDSHAQESTFSNRSWCGNRFVLRSIVRANRGWFCLPTEWQYVGKFLRPDGSFLAAGTCISRRFVLTANPVAYPAGQGKFQLDGGAIVTATARYRFLIPGTNEDADIALLDFGPLNNFPGWYPIYSGTNDIPSTATDEAVPPLLMMVGYGIQGNYNELPWGWSTGAASTAEVRQVGQNYASGTQTTNPLWFIFNYSDHDGNGYDRYSDGPEVSFETECHVASGDSGGPSFLYSGGGWRIAGVHTNNVDSNFFNNQHLHGFGSGTLD